MKTFSTVLLLAVLLCASYGAPAPNQELTGLRLGRAVKDITFVVRDEKNDTSNGDNGMDDKKNGMDDDKKNGMDDDKKNGMDDDKKNGMDDDKKNGMDDDKKNDKDDDKKNGMDDDKKNGTDDNGRDDDDDDDNGSTGGSSGSDTGVATGPGSSADAQAGNAPCFPAGALVILESGVLRRMSELSIGDRVAVGSGQYSTVFMFTHRLSDVPYKFVELSTSSGAVLRLTDGHYLPINGANQPAKRAAVGDFVELADGTASRITQVRTVADAGLYNPQTIQGDIVVDGVRASTYTEAVEGNAAHALLAPLRAAYVRFGYACRAFEGGARALVRLAPKA